MLGYVHPNVIFKNVMGGKVNATETGIDDFREMAQQSKTLFSLRRQEMTGYKSSGDTVTAEIRYEGVLAKDLPNGMRAGDVLRLDGRSEFRFQDEKLIEITDYS